MTDPLLQPLGTRMDRFGARCSFRRSHGQLRSAELQLPHTFIEVLQAASRPGRIGQHQGPTAFVQALVHFVPQLFGEATSQAGNLVAVALRGIDHQFASARHRARDCVGTEVARDDQGKGQLTLADHGSGSLFIRLINEPEQVARFKPAHHVLPHVEIVLPVLHTLIQIDQGDA